MSLCVIIMGTHGSGKTTIAKSLIKLFGGVDVFENNVTYCKDKIHSFVGEYESSKYGGVDGINGTKELGDIVKRALQRAPVVICEGAYICTAGDNVASALFNADKQLVVMLYTSPQVLGQRLLERSGTGLSETVIQKQTQTYNAVKKWKKRGVPILLVETCKFSIESCCDKIITRIKELQDVLPK